MTLAYDKLKRWIENDGGIYYRTLPSDVRVRLIRVAMTGERINRADMLQGSHPVLHGLNMETTGNVVISHDGKVTLSALVLQLLLD